MGYIKFRFKKKQMRSEESRLVSAKVCGLSSDWLAMGYDLPLILHALSSPGWVEEIDDECFDYTLDLVLD